MTVAPEGLLEAFPLRLRTTFQIGGPARYYLEAGSRRLLAEALAWCRDEGLPWFVLGAGSNVLVADEGFPGLVIRLGEEFRGYALDEAEGRVRAGAAVRVQKLGVELARHGFGGFEFMCGIPGTVGGAVKINAGTKEGEVKDRFLAAHLLDEAGVERALGAAEMGFAYRSTSLSRRRCVILSADFRLGPRQDPDALSRRVAEILAERREREPRVTRNCGSVFKKTPDGRSAGWWIERAGLKGYRVGDAMVAHEHANWILNLGAATAADVKSVILHVQEEVRERFGVELEREVLFVPGDLPAGGEAAHG